MILGMTNDTKEHMNKSLNELPENTMEHYQTFKEELKPRVLKLCHKIKTIP
jgi:hypothetical protein